VYVSDHTGRIAECRKTCKRGACSGVYSGEQDARDFDDSRFGRRFSTGRDTLQTKSWTHQHDRKGSSDRRGTQNQFDSRRRDNSDCSLAMEASVTAMIRAKRVLLADDHTLMLGGIRKILATKVELVGSVRDGRALIQAVEELRPDVVLLDISMPLLNGIDAARQIKKSHPETKLIFLTMHSDRDYVVEALRAGASGYLLKWSAEEELEAAIETVLRGGIYLTGALPKELSESLLKRNIAQTESPEKLSDREREVLQLVTEGRSAKEIADILHLSVKTVEFHKYRMMKRLGVHTTVELAKYAVQRHLLGLGVPRDTVNN
jgi:DNA-binding NarL/FixJ family response regulator